MEKIKAQLKCRWMKMLDIYFLVWGVHVIALAAMDFWFHFTPENVEIGFYRICMVLFAWMWWMTMRSSERSSKLYRGMLDDVFEAWRLQVKSNGEPHWLIWSVEHNAWWGPNEVGYVNHREKAGRYSLEHAVNIVRKANLCPKEGLKINEAIVHESEQV